MLHKVYHHNYNINYSITNYDTVWLEFHHTCHFICTMFLFIMDFVYQFYECGCNTIHFAMRFESIKTFS